MIFVDTNYFLRFLIKDNVQHKIAKSLFLQAARGKVELMSSIIVIFEVYWVLTSYYGKEKTQVSSILLEILNLNFSLEEKEILRQALEYFNKSNLSLEDCYNLFYAKEEKVEGFKTFDKRLFKAFEKL